MRNIALVPEGHIFQRGDGVASQDACKTSQPFPGDGVALVRHGAGAFLALGERFLGFKNFGALEMAEFHGPAFDARADEGKRHLKLRVNIALNDLSSDGGRAQTELGADEILDFGREMRAGADSTGDFSDSAGFPDAHEAFLGALKFFAHEGEFKSKGRRFSMNAVTAANARRELIFFGARGKDWEQLLNVGDEYFRALLHLQSQGGIPDIAAGEAVMEPSRGLVIDFFSDGGCETDNVMIEGLLEFLLAFDQSFQIGKPLVCAGFDFLEIFFGNNAFGHERLRREQFDLQPDFEFVLVQIGRPHVRAGITRNHGLIKKEKREIKKQKRQTVKASAISPHSPQRLFIRERAFSRISRSRAVRLWMPCAEILSRIGSTSFCRYSAGLKSSSGGFLDVFQIDR